LVSSVTLRTAFIWELLLYITGKGSHLSMENVSTHAFTRTSV